jgi:hypothetical protein
MKNNEKATDRSNPRSREETDFWDSIAEDVAAGYGAANEDRRKQNSQLNEDQLPDDHERGDA